MLAGELILLTDKNGFCKAIVVLISFFWCLKVQSSKWKISKLNAFSKWERFPRKLELNCSQIVVNCYSKNLLWIVLSIV